MTKEHCIASRGCGKGDTSRPVTESLTRATTSEYTGAVEAIKQDMVGKEEAAGLRESQRQENGSKNRRAPFI